MENLKLENPKEIHTHTHTHTEKDKWISSAELQDMWSIYRNQLCFYILSINNPEIKKITPFIIALKIKYLQINSIKEESKNHLNKWKEIPCSWTRKVNIVKMAVLPKWSIDSVQAISEFQVAFNRNWQACPKIYTVFRGPRIVKISHRTHTSWLENLLQSYSNQKSGKLA